MRAITIQTRSDFHLEAVTTSSSVHPRLAQNLLEIPWIIKIKPSTLHQLMLVVYILEWILLRHQPQINTMVMAYR